jgi:hypothetical protein
MALFNLPSHKYKGDRDLQEVNLFCNDFKIWLVSNVQFASQASSCPHRMAEFYGCCSDHDIGKIERIWDMKMYFSSVQSPASGPMFNLAIRKHNEYYKSIGKDPLHPDVNINMNICLPDPLCTAADILQDYITTIDNSAGMREYRSLKRDYWYSRFDLIRDRDKFLSTYGRVIKNIDDLSWALRCLDVYNSTQPVKLSPAFICGKARSMYYAKNNVGRKEGGTARRRMLDLVIPLLDARAPYKAISNMVDIISVRKEHIGNYLHWFEFYKNYLSVINRKTEGCFDEALSVVTNEFYRGYDIERHVDAKRIEYNRFGVELPDPYAIPEEERTIYVNGTSLKEQQEILEHSQNQLVELTPNQSIELPKIQGPYSAYLESKGMAKDPDSNFSIKLNFKKTSEPIIKDVPVIPSTMDFTIQEAPKKKERKKKATKTEDIPDGLIGAFLVLEKQVKVMRKMLIQEGYLKGSSKVEEIEPVDVDEDDEEEDTRDYSEFEATIQEPVFPPMTDQEFKEKTVLALDQEESYSRMSSEERNKFWVLKDHLEAETKRRKYS